jgi:hypothetical protein
LFSKTNEKLKIFKTSKEPKSELLYNKLSKTMKDEEKNFKLKKSKFQASPAPSTQNSVEEDLVYVEFEKKDVQKKKPNLAVQKQMNTEHDIASETLKEIVEVGRDLKDLNQMTKFLEEMVEDQGKKMEVVEDHIEETLFAVERGEQEIIKAEESHPMTGKGGSKFEKLFNSFFGK